MSTKIFDHKTKDHIVLVPTTQAVHKKETITALRKKFAHFFGFLLK